MEKKAFPGIRIEGASNYSPGYKIHYAGMDLRDYFAAKALTGLLIQEGYGIEHKEIEDTAYRIADEMMKRREIK